MESESIVRFLENKTILITGATGFLGKMLVEKILRIQPNVKKLYLLIRASDTESASHRMNTEIIGKELFKVLREKWDTNFDSFISQKVAAICGDVSFENLDLKDAQLRELLWKEIDMIIHSAATTNFDGRYDVSLGTNTLGVLHVLGFAKKCVKLQILVHVSTAYVCGEREGIIPEDTVFYTGKTIKTSSKLDFKKELKLVEEKLNKLQAQNASQDTITTIMSDFGIQRARLYGWPNTYVFTKAMGEICLKEYKEINMPLVTIRPAMVTSSYKEPFPGWIEGLRTVDGVIGAYGKGKMKFFLGSSMSILHLVPSDMVINLIVVAMVVHANQSSSDIIYYIGSSPRNPLYISNIFDFSFRYFKKNPLTNKKGKLVKVPKNFFLIRNMAALKMYLMIRFMLPLKILKLGNIASCQYFPDTYSDDSRKLKQIMRMLNLYKPYVLFKGIFDDGNAKSLQQTVGEVCSEILEVFNFDTECINWEDYMLNTHIPGLVKFVIKK